MPGRPFQKGQSGNPAGRPKSKQLTEALRKELDAAEMGTKQTRRQVLVSRMVSRAIAGDMQAAKLILSYTEGLPTQPIEHSGPDGARLRFTIRIAGDDGDGDRPAAD